MPKQRRKQRNTTQKNLDPANANGYKKSQNEPKKRNTISGSIANKDENFCTEYDTGISGDSVFCAFDENDNFEDVESMFG